ncbi:MAG: hypothetical protein AAF772_03570, partial [Acidobacteriota bacterium]
GGDLGLIFPDAQGIQQLTADLHPQLVEAYRDDPRTVRAAVERWRVPTDEARQAWDTLNVVERADGWNRGVDAIESRWGSDLGDALRTGDEAALDAALATKPRAAAEDVSALFARDRRTELVQLMELPPDVRSAFINGDIEAVKRHILNDLPANQQPGMMAQILDASMQASYFGAAAQVPGPARAAFLAGDIPGAHRQLPAGVPPSVVDDAYAWAMAAANPQIVDELNDDFFAIGGHFDRDTIDGDGDEATTFSLRGDITGTVTLDGGNVNGETNEVQLDPSATWVTEPEATSHSNSFKIFRLDDSGEIVAEIQLTHIHELTLAGDTATLIEKPGGFDVFGFVKDVVLGAVSIAVPATAPFIAVVQAADTALSGGNIFDVVGQGLVGVGGIAGSPALTNVGRVVGSVDDVARGEVLPALTQLAPALPDPVQSFVGGGAALIQGVIDGDAFSIVNGAVDIFSAPVGAPIAVPGTDGTVAVGGAPLVDLPFEEISLGVSSAALVVDIATGNVGPNSLVDVIGDAVQLVRAQDPPPAEEAPAEEGGVDVFGPEIGIFAPENVTGVAPTTIGELAPESVDLTFGPPSPAAPPSTLAQVIDDAQRAGVVVKDRNDPTLGAGDLTTTLGGIIGVVQPSGWIAHPDGSGGVAYESSLLGLDPVGAGDPSVRDDLIATPFPITDPVNGIPVPIGPQLEPDPEGFPVPTLEPFPIVSPLISPESFLPSLDVQTFGAVLEFVGGFVPGVGEIQDAAGLFNALMEHDPTGATVAGLSLLVGIFDPTPLAQSALRNIFRSTDDAAGLLARLGGALNNMSPTAQRNLGDAIQNLDEAAQLTIGKQAIELASEGVDGNVLNRVLRDHADPQATLGALQTSVRRMTDGGLSSQQITDLTRHLGPDLTIDLSGSFSGRMGDLGAFSDQLQGFSRNLRGELVQGLSSADSATRTIAVDLINGGIRPASIKDALVNTANPQSALQMINGLVSSTSTEAVNNVLRQAGIANTMTIAQAFAQDGVNPTAQAFGNELFERFGQRIGGMSNAEAQREVAAVRNLSLRESALVEGHSIQRHGPDITDAELQARLTQGVVPGEATPNPNPPSRSTRFSDYATQNLLQQRSYDEALAHLGLTPTSPPSSIGLNRNWADRVTIDWGESIGTGFEGVNRQNIRLPDGRRIRRYQDTQPIDPNEVRATTIGLSWDGERWQIDQFFPGAAGTGENAIERRP